MLKWSLVPILWLDTRLIPIHRLGLVPILWLWLGLSRSGLVSKSGLVRMYCLVPIMRWSGLVPILSCSGLIPILSRSGLVPILSRSGLVPVLSRSGLVPVLSWSSLVPVLSGSGLVPLAATVAVLTHAQVVGVASLRAVGALDGGRASRTTHTRVTVVTGGQLPLQSHSQAFLVAFGTQPSRLRITIHPTVVDALQFFIANRWRILCLMSSIRWFHRCCHG